MFIQREWGGKPNSGRKRYVVAGKRLDEIRVMKTLVARESSVGVKLEQITDTVDERRWDRSVEQ